MVHSSRLAGANSRGQLGLGDCISRLWPEPLTFPFPAKVQSVTAAADSSVAMVADGKVFTFGWLGASQHAKGGKGGEGEGLTLDLPTPLHLPSGLQVGTLTCAAGEIALLLRAIGTEGSEGAKRREGAPPALHDGRQGSMDEDDCLGPPTIVGDEMLAAEDALLSLDEGRVGGDGDESRGGGVLREGPLRHEMGWLRGSRCCWALLRREELLLLEHEAHHYLSSSMVGREIYFRLSLDRVDALSVSGCRIRARLSGGGDMVLFAYSAGVAQAWKLALQEARGGSPRRALLQVAGKGVAHFGLAIGGGEGRGRGLG